MSGVQELSAPRPSMNYDFSVGEYRQVKVVCIGAGFSGIIAGIRFTQKVPNLDLTIYEKEGGIGGTWHVNKYPGVACDIPAQSYQYSFEDNTEWSKIYASGAEILADLQRIVEKYKLNKYMRFRHELTHAAWDEHAGLWRLRVRRTGEIAEFEDTADVLFLGVGPLNRPMWPDIPGLRGFRGFLLHTAHWDVGNVDGAQDNDGIPQTWNDKVVGVIGNGSSGLQIVPALQPKVGSLMHFARSKTWISSSFALQKVFQTLGRAPGNNDLRFSAEERTFLRNSENCKRFRREIEAELHSYGGQFSIRGSELQKIFAGILAEDTKKQLASHPELIKHFIPTWGVSCRRLTPGPGYFEALCSDNTMLETTGIARITPTGVELLDGRTHEVDVLVCATGFDTSFRYPFSVVGRGGYTLSERWAPATDVAGPEAYLSLAVDGFPNLFICGGPNSGVTSGSFVTLAEHVVGYVVEAVRKMQRERLRSMEVRREAAEDWSSYVRGYFPKTIYTDPCSSWFKDSEGHVIALWPGTCLHAIYTLANPRWEDFVYELLDSTKGRFSWLGDGQTYNQRIGAGNRVWHLDVVDVPAVPTE
ncbi:FAD/NAD-P-binding domain-containing protein [Russula earlei]|uniref:FAD/NAD-P-binding domain-containing protein n=1 Tax=Russula earlei TaxID=71964 RepID=A0ACC0UI59_9AGAM|nr:FAD/NAD-P-binding domain-containing protein [Russula earlei]